MLLCGVAAMVLPLMILVAGPAMAQTFVGIAGVTGISGSTGSDGAGGAAGTDAHDVPFGGNGSSGGIGGVGGTGGTGGGGQSGTGITITNTGSTTGGGGGGGGTGGGGGGGGGGGSSYTGLGLPIAGSSGSGGTGGDGGSGATSGENNPPEPGGDGGAGGAGGIGGTGGSGGAGISGTNIVIINDGSITGGTGGAGGAGGVGGGGGGGGGNGVFAGGSGGSPGQAGGLGGALDGGAGAAGATGADGTAGAGGAGIAGSGLTVINSGTIAGGMSGGSSPTQADAIDFTGGSNTLTLETGSALNGDIEVGGTGSVSFDQTTAQTLGNVITGTGSVIQDGTGTLTLTGDNTYTGGTAIDAGTLTAGVSDAFSEASVTAVNTGGVLDLGGLAQNIDTVDLAGGTIQNGTLTSSNGIASTGGTIDDIGGTTGLTTTAGTTTLLGSNSFTDGTAVGGGTLEVGDAADPGTVLTSNVSVASGGTLRGHGTIDGNVVNNGVVFPGGSIGILTVSDNFTQNSGGTLTIEITPGTGFDQLQVGGSASLAGALVVQVDNGSVGSVGSVGSQDDILHAAGGVSGSFSTATTTFSNPALAAFITPMVSVSADDVTLELTPTLASPNGNLTDALAFSTGRIYAASNFAQNGALFNVLSTPLGGTGTAGTDTDQGYWLHGLGAFGQANGFDFNEEGFVIGKGFAVSPNLTLGGGISNVYTVTSGGASAANGTSVGALVYGLYTAGPATISASAMAGHLGTNISRGLPTLGETAQATSTGAYEGAALHLQYNLLSGSRFFVAPYASVSYLHTGLGGATETGAGTLDLHYDAMSTSLAQLGAGVSGGLSIPVQYGTLTAWAALGGEGTLGNPHVSNTEVLGSFSAGETTLAAPVGAFTPAIGVTLTGHGPWRLAAAWGGQFGSATSAENFSLEARYVW
jgi:hypothetical protein